MENKKNPLITSNDSNPNEDPSFMERQKQLLAQRLAQNATEEITKGWYESCFSCNLEFMHKYFEVKTSEVISRILHSFIPFNPKLYEISKNNPDFYGPFWIYSTLIFVLAASGALSKFLNGQSTQAFFQNFVPIATAVIYGIGFLLPVLLTILMKCFGSETTFISTFCIYGYSFSIYIPLLAVCAVPYEWLQWLLIGYGVFSSTGLLLVSFWQELGKYIEKRRYIILAIVLIFQVGLFFAFKLYFFQNVIDNVVPKPVTPVIPNNIQNVTNVTNITNSTNHSYY